MGVFNSQVPTPPKNRHMGYGFYQTRFSFFSACRATCGRLPSVTIQLRPSFIHIGKCVPVAIGHQDKGHNIKCSCDATSYLHTPSIFVDVSLCCACVYRSKLVFWFVSRISISIAIRASHPSFRVPTLSRMGCIKRVFLSSVHVDRLAGAACRPQSSFAPLPST